MNRTLRVGIFTAIGLFFVIAMSVYVNDRPYWYRICNRVPIHVDDATGLRRKSPVRTLGLEIGYIDKVTLDGDKVLIAVCVTAPVKLVPQTRAYIKSAGFLGDKFLELKPMAVTDDEGSIFSRAYLKNRATGDGSKDMDPGSDGEDAPAGAPAPSREPKSRIPFLPIDRSEENSGVAAWLWDALVPSAHAEETDPPVEEEEPATPEEAPPPVVKQARRRPGEPLKADRDAEISDTVKKVGKLVDQLTLMVGDLREVTRQKDFKETIVNLNKAMKHLETLLRPNGKTVTNLNAAMDSLRKMMADAETVMKRVKDGEGTIGKFVNDPSIYDELKAAIKSVNLLLGKAGTLRTFVDMSGWQVKAYDGVKARFSVTIQPNPGRYYLIGLASDPRGRNTVSRTTTSVNGGSTTVEDKTVNEEKGLKITAVFGKYFGPLDLKAGIIEDSGAVGIGLWLDENRRHGVHAELYAPSRKEAFTTRVWAKSHLWSGFYVTGGVDAMRKYNGSLPYFFGAGIYFDDDDLKYLLAFK
ncbi:MAG: MCE family protein [Bdellovibrionales bacterium]|nr:MCE family protein [Bdellovibrionales bacterium]